MDLVAADEEWLTTAEVVARYRLPSRSAFYAMRSRGKGPLGYRFGRQLRFRSADLDAWVAALADRGKNEAVRTS